MNIVFVNLIIVPVIFEYKKRVFYMDMASKNTWYHHPV